MMFHQCGGLQLDIDWEWVRRWRWPLLTLAVLVGGFVTVLGVLQADKNWRRHEAAAQIQKLGGSIDSFGLSFRKRPVGDEALALVEVFDEITSVDVADTRVA